MKIGLIGAGKMGIGLARNIKQHGHEVVIMTRSEEKAANFANEGFEACTQEYILAESLEIPRIIWLMVPAGDPVDEAIDQLLPYLKAEDILIDGGNSNFRDSVIRAEYLAARGIYYLDIGTSGGTAGALKGACMMVGGDRTAFLRLEPLIKEITVDGGYGYFGPSGAGHYVKMVHNGIEYAMMQSVSEGFELLRKSEYQFDLEKIAQVYNHGSIVEGYLMGITAASLGNKQAVESLEPVVRSSGEGLWTVEEALRLRVPVETIAFSLMRRYGSEGDGFGARLLSMMRHQFGGHDVVKREE
jgi:6-phosphogluconate dehydrogenase